MSKQLVKARLKPKPLKLKLWRTGSDVSMRVLQQEETTRGRFVLWEDEKTKMQIVSSVGPGLDYEKIFVWGVNQNEDDDFCIISFETSEEAKEYAERVIKTINNYNAELGSTYAQDSEVYIVG